MGIRINISIFLFCLRGILFLKGRGCPWRWGQRDKKNKTRTFLPHQKSGAAEKAGSAENTGESAGNPSAGPGADAQRRQKLPPFQPHCFVEPYRTYTRPAGIARISSIAAQTSAVMAAHPAEFSSPKTDTST